MTMLNHSAVRILSPLLTLGVFYWALFGNLAVQSTVDIQGVVPSAQLTPEESRQLLEQSTVLRRQAKYEEALVPILRLHRAYPENQIYIDHLATLYGQLGRHKDEAEYWEKYLQRAPVPVEACPQIGKAYEKQGLARKAIDAYERCLAIEPENTDSIFFLAHALEMAKQFDRAAELYAGGATLAPEYHDMRVGLARVRLHQGRYDQARAAAGEVLEHSPNNVDAMLVLGLANWREGHRLEAKQFLERGVKLSQGYSDFYVALGGIAEQENNVQQAIQAYNRVLALEPGNQEIARRRDALTRAH